MKKQYLILILLTIVAASLPTENNQLLDKKTLESQDITEFMECYEDMCKSILDPIMKDFSLTLEYLSVIGCMKTNESCQNIEQEEFKVYSMEKCCVQCFQGRKFSRKIQKLNSCHLSCVQEVATKFKPTVLELTMQESADNEWHWETYGLAASAIAITLTGGYLLYKKRRMEKLQKQPNLTNKLDLKFDSSEL